MTNIEQKALELIDAVKGERNGDVFSRYDAKEALCRAIERHEAFRQEVSDAVEKHKAGMYLQDTALDRFIIAKPDPLVEAMVECGVDPFESWADQLRAALAKRGLEIREKE